MTKLTVGIIDYGVGNLTSVKQCFHNLGLRCRVSGDSEVLNACDLLLLPGVGAFPFAMQALLTQKLDQFLVEKASEEKPILGICLGMQLLTNASYEGGYTKGIGLIPGEIIPLGPRCWHIGWNVLDQVSDDPLFQSSNGQAFYFNHSFVYQGPEEFQVCKTHMDESFCSVIRCGNIVGMQFHPEKSQDAGRVLLRHVVEGLCNA
jgi:glutamine amidotransferase